MKNLINCGTCGYPLTPEERTTLIENKGVMQKPWVSLTDEEAQWLYDNCRTPFNLIDMTEARLKEKNT
jgi:hypothetical protein